MSTTKTAEQAATSTKAERLAQVFAENTARRQAAEDAVLNGTATDDQIDLAAEAAAHETIVDELKSTTALKRLRRRRDFLDKGITRLERSVGARVDTAAPEGCLIIDRQVDPPQPHHLGIIADRGATLIYGRGGVGKGSYVAHLILRMIRDLGWYIALIDSEERDYEWKPRLIALGATPEELAHIFYVVPHGPIWDQTDPIQALLDEHSFKPDIVIVDSVARACRIDLSTGDDSLPARFYEALDRLCNRHLSIAHVTGAGNLEKPFGSQRWHDDARVTWSLEDKGEDKLLKLRKDNTALRPPNLLVSVPARSWTVIDGLPYPSKIIENRYQEALADLIYGSLDDTPLNYDQIVELVNETLSEDQKPHTQNAVKLAITRDRTGRFHRTGTKQRPLWSHAASDTLSDTLSSWTCHNCSGPLDPDQAQNVAEGDVIHRIHRNGCPETQEQPS